MTKWAKITAFCLAFVLLMLAALAGYYVHTLSFNERVICAVGEPVYRPVSPLCRVYVGWTYPLSSPAEREKASMSLEWLISTHVRHKDTVIAERSLALADRFLAEGANVNFVDAEGYTPLHSAVLAGDPRLVEFLLKHGANPDKRTFIQSLDAKISPRELATELATSKNARDDVDWPMLIALLGGENQKKP